MNKKVYIYIIGLVLTLVSIVIGISFSYLLATQSLTNNLAVNVSFANGVVANFSVAGNTNITLNVTGDKLLQGSAGNVALTNSAQMTVTLKSDVHVACSYDIVWLWDSSTPNQYTKVANNEFTVAGQTTSYSFAETQVPDYSSGSVVLGSYTIEANNSTATQTWQYTAKFYNLTVNQDTHANKTYKGKITVQNAFCGNVEYKLASATTFNNNEYADTGVYLDWDEDFVFDGVINVPGTGSRRFVIGSYGEGAKGMNIELTTANKLRLYLGSSGHDKNNGTIPTGVDTRIYFKWTADTGSYVAYAINTQTGATVASISNPYTASGQGVKVLRIGAKDYRTGTNPFQTITVKSMLIY